MPRPQRCRRICREPAFDCFQPEGISQGEPVVLTLDEFEVIRLVDLEKKTHLQCAEQMDISRTTVTEIYESARTKLAECLVNGRRLEILGGNYRFCDGSQRESCGSHRCRHIHDRQPMKTYQKKREDFIMRIAVTYEDGQIFQHFGHTQQFKLYDVEHGAVTQEQVVDTCGSGHGALAGFLQEHQVDVLICGGIGGGAQNALAQAGIRLYGGVTGSADDAVQALLADTLSYNPDVRCSHHEHAHGEGGHSCGGHGHEGHVCGEHGCK